MLEVVRLRGTIADFSESSVFPKSSQHMRPDRTDVYRSSPESGSFQV